MTKLIDTSPPKSEKSAPPPTYIGSKTFLEDIAKGIDAWGGRENAKMLIAEWVCILNLVAPYSTRVLMSCQVLLLEVTDQKAILGVRSSPLFEMAKGRIENMEDAFRRFYGKPIKIELQLLIAYPQYHQPI